VSPTTIAPVGATCRTSTRIDVHTAFPRKVTTWTSHPRPFLYSLCNSTKYLLHRIVTFVSSLCPDLMWWPFHINLDVRQTPNRGLEKLTHIVKWHGSTVALTINEKGARKLSVDLLGRLHLIHFHLFYGGSQQKRPLVGSLLSSTPCNRRCKNDVSLMSLSRRGFGSREMYPNNPRIQQERVVFLSQAAVRSLFTIHHHRH
jgi:hypothetical protein